jgi:Cu-processing system permease protein
VTASVRTTAILCAKEMRDARRNRWFLLFAVAFSVLALALSYLSLAGAARVGFAGLGRTTASLINLVLLVVPLMGLTLGSAAIAGERERGQLLYTLAQPITVGEYLLGKFLGLTLSTCVALLLGFGVAALAIGRRSGAAGAGAFAGFLGLTLLLAAASVSLGLLLSAMVERSSVATGVALFAWFGFVFIGDLGVMGTSLMLRLEARHLLLMTLVNPLQEFKLMAVLLLRGGLESLGPAGLYATRTLGGAVSPLLIGLLAAWTAGPLLAALAVLRRRGAL